MVLVVDKHKKPCNTISEAYARRLLFKKQAVIHKRFPFTIRLKNDNAVLKDRSYTVKIDPGSRHTGVAVVDDKASKSVKGFQTGDMVKAIVPKGLKKEGEYLGRVVVKSSGYFDIQTRTKTIEGIGYKYCHIVQRSDGYLYSYNERSSLGNE